jgi:hypothetical protein
MNSLPNNFLILCYNNQTALVNFFKEYDTLNFTGLEQEFRNNRFYGMINGCFKTYTIEELSDIYSTDVKICTLTMIINLLEQKNDINTKTFPRVMWVKDKKDDNYTKRTVLCYARNKFIAFCTNDEDLTPNSLHGTIYSTYIFDEAIELEDLTVLTKEDIAKLANTTVDKLKIIE